MVKYATFSNGIKVVYTNGEFKKFAEEESFDSWMKTLEDRYKQIDDARKRTNVSVEKTRQSSEKSLDYAIESMIISAKQREKAGMGLAIDIDKNHINLMKKNYSRLITELLKHKLTLVDPNLHVGLNKLKSSKLSYMKDLKK